MYAKIGEMDRRLEVEGFSTVQERIRKKDIEEKERLEKILGCFFFFFLRFFVCLFAMCFLVCLWFLRNYIHLSHVPI